MKTRHLHLPYIIFTIACIFLTVHPAIGQKLFYIKNQVLFQNSNDTELATISKQKIYVSKLWYDLFEQIWLRQLEFKSFYDTKSQTLAYRGKTEIDSCQFIETTNYNALVYPKYVYKTKALEIKNSAFKGEFTLGGSITHFTTNKLLDSRITFTNSKFDEFKCRLFNGNFELNNARISNPKVDLIRSNIKLTLRNNTALAEIPLQYSITESRLVMNISSDKKSPGNQFYFDTDTIDWLGATVADASPISINLEESQINGLGYFIGSKLAPFKISINNCHFPKETVLNLENVDTLSLTNCKKIEKPIRLNVNNHGAQKKLMLSLTNSNMGLIDFDFTDNLQLYFDKDSNIDDKNKTFEALLEKFKKEGKINSYQQVDIQYKKFFYSQYGFAGTLLSQVNYYWWNYGYSRLNIIGWTLAFLVIFFLINLVFSKQMLEFYPILQTNSSVRNPGFSFLKSLKNIISVFIFTVYIFFSLRVDFEKVDNNRTILLLYFFIQYFTGLVCLFFLFNTILKL